eukprot:scaffold174761_cov42-Prasinocladus_malaysianus.AAC.1
MKCPCNRFDLDTYSVPPVKPLPVTPRVQCVISKKGWSVERALLPAGGARGAAGGIPARPGSPAAPLAG